MTSPLTEDVRRYCECYNIVDGIDGTEVGGIIEDNPACVVHHPPPAWLPSWTKALIVTWRSARRDPNRGQLTIGDHLGWTHGWWLTPYWWGIGVELGPRGIVVTLGPFSWEVYQPT